MEHVAIMKKSWKLTQKILTGQKKIESRWYKSKYPPWDRIKQGEVVYFKNSGDPVTIKTQVSKVLQFSNLTQEKVKDILEEYGNDDGITHEDVGKFFQLFKDKKYCILVFLKNPEKIKPFNINKKCYGAMAAWMMVSKIGDIKK